MLLENNGDSSTWDELKLNFPSALLHIQATHITFPQKGDIFIDACKIERSDNFPLSKINHNIWTKPDNNIKWNMEHNKGHMSSLAFRIIVKPGNDLSLDYGPGYNWDFVKSRITTRLSETINTLVSHSKDNEQSFLQTMTETNNVDTNFGTINKFLWYCMLKWLIVLKDTSRR
jgi:hypothetical protein